MVVSIKEIMHDDEAVTSLTEAISNFKCQDKDVESFLKEKAFEFELRDKSRTYLIFDDIGKDLLGYYNLSLDALPLRRMYQKVYCVSLFTLIYIYTCPVLNNFGDIIGITIIIKHIIRFFKHDAIYGTINLTVKLDFPDN